MDEKRLEFQTLATEKSEFGAEGIVQIVQTPATRKPFVHTGHMFRLSDVRHGNVVADFNQMGCFSGCNWREWIVGPALCPGEILGSA